MRLSFLLPATTFFVSVATATDMSDMTGKKNGIEYSRPMGSSDVTAKSISCADYGSTPSADLKVPETDDIRVSRKAEYMLEHILLDVMQYVNSKKNVVDTDGFVTQLPLLSDRLAEANGLVDKLDRSKFPRIAAKRLFVSEAFGVMSFASVLSQQWPNSEGPDYYRRSLYQMRVLLYSLFDSTGTPDPTIQDYNHYLRRSDMDLQTAIYKLRSYGFGPEELKQYENEADRSRLLLEKMQKYV